MSEAHRSLGGSINFHVQFVDRDYDYGLDDDEELDPLDDYSGGTDEWDNDWDDDEVSLEPESETPSSCHLLLILHSDFS